MVFNWFPILFYYIFFSLKGCGLCVVCISLTSMSSLMIKMLIPNLVCTTWDNWNIVERGIKHPNQQHVKTSYMMAGNCQYFKLTWPIVLIWGIFITWQFYVCNIYCLNGTRWQKGTNAQIFSFYFKSYFTMLVDVW